LVIHKIDGQKKIGKLLVKKKLYKRTLGK